MVRIVSYNILSTKLSSQDHFNRCDPKYLAINYRWEKIQQKLSGEIENGAIICLQEVSTEWLEKLTPFFESNDYIIIGGTYGYPPYDGDLGVFIAYPFNMYKLQKLSLSKPGREIKKYTTEPTKSRYKQLICYIFWLIVFLFQFPIIRSIPFKDKLIKIIKKEDHWQKAIAKDNILVLARFQSRENEEKIFCVANYHMPCNFTNPSLMLIHSSIAIKIVDTFAGKDRYIFAGDFNTKPCEPVYKMITGGGSIYNRLVEPSTNRKIHWITAVDNPLLSVYKEANGKEPEFTNYSFTKNGQFKDCIDYIFCSKGWKVDKVITLPIETISDSYPSENQPSDHLLLGADLIAGDF